MILQERREEIARKKRRTRFLVTFLSVVTALMILAALALFVFRTKQLEIVGNEIYDADTLYDVIMSEDMCEYSWYLFLKYRFFAPDTMPFIDTIEVDFASPSHLVATIYEKETIGCFYMEEEGCYCYFDKDGIISEQSATRLDDVILVQNLNPVSTEMYEVMELDDPYVLGFLLNVVLALKKYDYLPDAVEAGEYRTMILHYGDVEVLLGKNELVDEKILYL